MTTSPGEAFEKAPLKEPLFSKEVRSEIVLFAGRMKEMLKKDGRKIGPDEEEQLARFFLQEIRENSPHRVKSTAI